ncbi:MAG: hypothetical protein R2744_07565 [Bacteroidales bacterium]
MSGVVNTTRAKVTGIGADFIIVNDVTGFATGDTVVVVQMKGDAIIISNDGNFGIHDNHVGDGGYYEFIVVQAVESGTKKITFYNNLKGAYDVTAFVQVVKVESYETLRVTGEITVRPGMVLPVQEVLLQYSQVR